MYLYDELDRTLIAERVAEFRDQIARRLSGELTEEEFKPLRLMNGVYLQLHAYMLRIAIPYGTLSSEQLRMLAQVARRYDRSFGHYTIGRTSSSTGSSSAQELLGRDGRPLRASACTAHADQRQQCAQHHDRPVGRRRA